jgi:hypothetical protein
MVGKYLLRSCGQFNLYALVNKFLKAPMIRVEIKWCSPM